MYSASASVGREADMVVCSQGTIYGRYWRGFFGSTRACASLPNSAFPLYRSAKRLLKGKRNAKGPKRNVRDIVLRHHLSYLRLCCRSAKSAGPSPPYPPPRPFVPFTSETIKNQIGLLRGYFEQRLAGLDSLPGDPQNPAQTKLDPLG